MRGSSRSPSRASAHSRADSNASGSGLSNLSFLSSIRGGKKADKNRFFSPKANFN
jgi:hypothetical protein